MIRLGIVGWPLSSTLSPQIHCGFLEQTGLTGCYDRLPVDPAGFDSAMAGLQAEGYEGLNVTYPHKMAAAGLCGALDHDARKTGAVNTLTLSDGAWAGSNTDVSGFRRAAEELGLEGPVLVVGAGGAASAAALALTRMEKETVVCCRRPRSWKGPGRAVDLGSAEEELERGLGTVINATPLGWKNGDSFPLEPESLRGLLFFDLNYNPRWEWRNNLEGIAARVETGLRMLVYQAAESFETWTGRSPDTISTLKALHEKGLR